LGKNTCLDSVFFNARAQRFSQSAQRVYVKLWKSPISEVENAVWAAMSAGGAEAAVRWDSCRLDFFGTFLIKQKSTEKIEITKH